MENYDVVIIGGGLAGLTAAIHLSQDQKMVLVIEKNNYPAHKVCGEYVSREVLPYLESLGISFGDTAQIDRLQLSNSSGKYLEVALPLGGVGISRYSLDHRLYQRAMQVGVNFLFETVNSVSFHDESFEIGTLGGHCFSAKIVLGAFGKRSSLDKTLKRSFTFNSAPWLGVKAHYRFPEHPSDLVGIHAFNGGYGGLSKTETGDVNFCYLAHYNSFRKYGNIEDFNMEVVSKNPFLRELLTTGEPLFDKPLSIAQISFQNKQMIDDHILMCGDSAGLIHPLCGNGMAMAIHSAQIASDLVLRYLSVHSFSRTALENEYERLWKQNFSNRLWWGRRLQSLLLNNSVSDMLFGFFSGSRLLTQTIIKKTHGKTLEVT